MSGGSMDYLYSRLECDATFRENTLERRAFAKHLKLVAKALHDIEWVDSGDYGPGDDTEAIRACLSSDATLEAAVEAAHDARKALTAELERACSLRPDLEMRVTLDGRGELPAEMWSDNGVPWSDVADAKSGTRTTIYGDDGRKLVIEPRHGR